ncbi:MAG TPA: DUF4167 domain-containing protein [Hyphomicrobium sp.]|jgi:hypothetical protein
MRQGQQNRRGRGRNRKGQSPLTRSFESTGPDVKIRGTPAHIAEKYMSLARDASSSGDPVLAENYLQHAEHYNRIIMAFRDQQIAQGGEPMNGSMGRQRSFMHDPMDPGDDFSDEDGDEGDFQPSHPGMRHNDPQPTVDGQRFEGQQREQRGGNDQHRYRERPERHGRQGGQDRGPDPRGFGQPRQQNAEVGAEPAGGQSAPEAQPRRRGERFTPTHEQPEFLRRPVRRPRRESSAAPSEANGVAEETEQD